MRRTVVQVLLICTAAMLGCSGEDRSLSGTWLFSVDSLGIGEQENWYVQDHDRSTWKTVDVPHHWDDTGLESYDGSAWYTTSFLRKTPSPLSLVFKGVDDDADVWVNGTYLGGHTGYSEPFSIDVPDSLRMDSLTVVVRVIDHGGPGGIYAPVMIVPSSDAEAYMKSPFADEHARESADWVTSAVIYEVYLRSFSSEGTFRALQDRLPELQDLGVTVLWLMPIHPVGELNRKGRLGSPYAVQDYKSVNPAFGTMGDFKTLVHAAHQLQMKVIIDFVADHTAWDNEMLIRHPEWYSRDEEGAIISPNADWTDVAELNYDHHELRKHMIDVMRFWVTETDIDGYRCDVAELIPLDFWEHARYELDKIKPIVMLSEGRLPEQHLRAFDITYAWSTYDMLEPLFNGRSEASVISSILRMEALRFPKGSLFLRFDSNHDKNAYEGPVLTRLGSDGAMLASTTMFVLPGIPLIYNGEEAANSRVLTLFDAVPIDWTGGSRMRAHFKKLTALRSDNPWLSTGPWRVLPQKSAPGTVVIMRTNEEDGDMAVMAILNFSESSAKIDIPMPVEFKDRMLKDHFTEARMLPAKRFTMTLPARGFSVIYTLPGG